MSIKDWKLVSLCNVLHKVITKFIAKHIKKKLDKCTSDNQSTFAHGRSILDNDMEFIELVDYVKSKTRDMIGVMALKLDIGKV